MLSRQLVVEIGNDALCAGTGAREAIKLVAMVAIAI